MKSIEDLLNQLSSAWLDAARAKSVVVSILWRDRNSLLVSRADRVETSFQAVETPSDIWDEDEVLDVVDDLAGCSDSTVSRYEIIPINAGQLEGGVIVEGRARRLDNSALNEMTQLTKKRLRSFPEE